jgi:hypothetical protein
MDGASCLTSVGRRSVCPIGLMDLILLTLFASAKFFHHNQLNSTTVLRLLYDVSHIFKLAAKSEKDQCH